MKKTLIVLAALILITSTCFAEDSWDGNDKFAHVGGGTIISLLVYPAFRYGYEMPVWKAALSTLVVGATLNIFKESVMDDTFSGKDIAAGTLGNVMGLTLFMTCNGDYKNWGFGVDRQAKVKEFKITAKED